MQLGACKTEILKFQVASFHFISLVHVHVGYEDNTRMKWKKEKKKCENNATQILLGYEPFCQKKSIFSLNNRNQRIRTSRVCKPSPFTFEKSSTAFIQGTYFLLQEYFFCFFFFFWFFFFYVRCYIRFICRTLPKGGRSKHVTVIKDAEWLFCRAIAMAMNCVVYS